MIQYIHQNRVHSINKNLDEIAPATTLLQYLRLHLVRTGTKEGCAAGDCGACTVVLGERVNGTVKYVAVNACITPVSSIHGKHLITIEDLAKPFANNGAPELSQLHPVQRAMVECHGSQCGFCTPGIIMSLYCWWHSVKNGDIKANRHTIEQALSGNLCRCTGYQPILRAAQKSLSYDVNGGDSAVDAKHIDLMLASIPTAMSSPKDSLFMRPTTSAELVDCMIQNPNTSLIAGATDIGLEFTQALKQPKKLIYTRDVAEFNRLEDGDDQLIIGASVTYSRAHSLIAEYFPAFSRLIDRLGSLQIRNQATLGGNVANASPIGDTPPVLLALGAGLMAVSPRGTREIPIEQFFLGYRKVALQAAEALQHIVVPKLKDNEYLRAYKISKRFDDDISAVCMAIWLKFDGAIALSTSDPSTSTPSTSDPSNDITSATIIDIRIAFGGMAATPARARQTEQALRNTRFDTASLENAKAALLQDFSPLDDVRASAKYRLAVAGSLVERCQQELLGISECPPWEPPEEEEQPILHPSDGLQPQSPLFYEANSLAATTLSGGVTRES